MRSASWSHKALKILVCFCMRYCLVRMSACMLAWEALTSKQKRKDCKPWLFKSIVSEISPGEIDRGNAIGIVVWNELSDTLKSCLRHVFHKHLICLVSQPSCRYVPQCSSLLSRVCDFPKTRCENITVVENNKTIHRGNSTTTWKYFALQEARSSSLEVFSNFARNAKKWNHPRVERVIVNFSNRHQWRAFSSLLHEGTQWFFVEFSRE